MYKILIRPLEKKDALISWKWRNDAEVWAQTGNRPDKPITLDIEIEWIKKVIKDKTTRRFAITVDDQYVGNVQLTEITDSHAQFHIFIGEKSFWGKGVANQATYQILTYAKEVLKLNEVYLYVKKSNVSAIKVYEKNSFIEDGQDNENIKMICKLIDLAVPMVSIFCMVYNHEKYIAQCLDGFLFQKCNFNYTIVLGEDFSRDNSRNIILMYVEKYPGKFKLLLNNENVGAHKNQELVLKNCHGKYIAICEGDDYWTDPLKLQKQVDFLEANPDYGLVLTDFNILNQSTGKIEESLFKNEPKRFPVYKNFVDFLYAAGYMAPCTWLLRKEFLPTYTKNYVDGTFAWLLEVYAKSKVGFIKDTTTVYRLLDESASHSKSLKKRFQRSKGVLKIQLDFIEKYALNVEFRLKVLQKYYKMILPTLVALNEKEEIAKALFYLPKVERAFKDNLLFLIAKMPFGSNLMKVIYNYK